MSLTGKLNIPQLNINYNGCGGAYAFPSLNSLASCNSIYNIAGGCGMFPSYDYMSGQNTGYMVSGILGGISNIFLQAAISGKFSKSNNTQVSKDYQLDIDKQLATLNSQGGNYTVDNYKDAKVETKYDTAITEARTSISTKVNSLTSDISAKESELKNLKEPGAEATESEKTAYNQQKTALEDEIAKLKAQKKALEKVTDSTTKEVEVPSDLDSGVQALLKAFNDAIVAKAAREAEIQKAIEAIEGLLTKAEDEVDLNDALNKKDGSAASRLFDGKNSPKDKLHNLRKLMDKFNDNPFSLTIDEIQTLEGGANILDNDNTDSAKQIKSSITSWLDSHKTLLSEIKDAKQGCLSKHNFQIMQQYGCFKTKDQQVGHENSDKTMETVYIDKNSGNKYYLDKEGNPIKV